MTLYLLGCAITLPFGIAKFDGDPIGALAFAAIWPIGVVVTAWEACLKRGME